MASLSRDDQQKRAYGPTKSLYFILKSFRQQPPTSSIFKLVDSVITHSLQVTDNFIASVSKVPSIIKQPIQYAIQMTDELNRISKEGLSLVQHKLTNIIQKLGEHDDARIDESKQALSTKTSKIRQKTYKIIELLSKKGLRRVDWYYQNPNLLATDVKSIARRGKISIYAMANVVHQLYVDSVELLLRTIGVTIRTTKDTVKLVFSKVFNLESILEVLRGIGVAIKQMKQEMVEIFIDPQGFRTKVQQLAFRILQRFTRSLHSTIQVCSSTSTELYNKTIRNYRQQKQTLERKYRKQKYKAPSYRL